MGKEKQRASELYPDSRAFCGGAAHIARTAFRKGWGDCRNEIKEAVKKRIGVLESIGLPCGGLKDLLNDIEKDRIL